MKLNLTKLILISLGLNVLLLFLAIFILKGNSNLRRGLHDTENAFIQELEGVQITTAKNGTQLGKVQTQMVTKDMLRALENKLGTRMEDMGVRFNDKIKDITLYNTVTTYNVKDSNVIITDTAYTTSYTDTPWIQYSSTFYPLRGTSESNIQVFDSIMLLGTWGYDKSYWWPKRLWMPKITEVTVNNANPYSKISYLKQYKLTKKWGGE